ncbi:haloacid dehalogenase [Ligilactobacillus ruminis]|uniref:haloacid dehalogenase n=1 Tax=Ligilactobacillus ruminis TaxID=1623 RepID=UPI0022E2E8A1|nr:haloacid dehalogenase [Ligilactobacillus ruminis]
MLDKGVDLRLLLSGIFSILISGNRLLLPNAVLRSICLISAPRQDYGQKADS